MSYAKIHQIKNSNRNLKAVLSFFFLLLFTTISYSQQYSTSVDTLNCNGGTTTFIVDLSANADTTWTSPPQTRDGDCCGTDNNCVQFALTLAPGSVGINFFIPGGCGAEPSGALYYQVDCGPLTSVGEPLCLDGTGPFILTFCKPGNNANCYSIQSIPSPSSSGDVVTADGCTDTLSISGLTPTSISWNSLSPGAPGAYNGLLTDLSGISNGVNGVPFMGFETVVVTPGIGSPSTIEYIVCGDVVGFCIMEPWCDTVSVSIYPTLFANIQPDPAVICAGGIAETLTANPIGGTAPYYYLWSTSADPLLNGSTSQTIDVTIPGEYTVMISDVTGCPFGFDTVVVTEYSNNITVNAGPDITICGTPTPTVALNGTSPVTSAGVWTNYTGTFSASDTNLIVNYTPSAAEIAAGFADLVLMSTYNYSCPGATDTITIFLSQFTAALSLTQTNVSCIGLNDGSIDLTVTGSPAPFTYLWSNGSMVEDVSGLSPVLYEAFVTDANGCVDSIETTITEPTALEVIDTTFSDYSGFNISCFGFNDGSIDISPSGGTGSYTFSWSTTSVSGVNVSNEDQTGLSVGTYNVTVTDANGCQIFQSYTLTQPTQLTEMTTAYVYPSGDNISCPGASDGSIDLTNTGGIPGYTYVWTTLDGSGLTPNSQDQSGLTVGTYEVIATDQNGCDISSVITLTEPIPLTEATAAFIYPSGDNISCTGASDGSIDLTIGAGTPPFTYLWSTTDGSGLVGSNEDQSGLTAGTYDVTTTDANGCTITSSITLVEPTPLTASTTAINISCFGSNDGSIDLTNTDGSPGYTYSWSTSNGSGLSPTTEDQSGLTIGTYNVTTTDTNGCVITSAVTLTEPLPLAITLTPSVYAGGYNISGCTNDGFIDLQISGGSPAYDFLWTTLNGSGLVTIDEDQSGLTAGTYDVTATDANGCTITTSITLINPSMLTESTTAFVYPSGDNISCFGLSDGSIDLTNTGGVPPYSYAWSTSDGSGLVVSNEDQSGLTAGTYSVTTTDANGCSIISTITLIEPTPLTDSLGAFIYPSGDNISCFGFNDGSIDLTISDGSPGYSYTWTTSDGSGLASATEDQTGLTAGTYNVTSTDINGCTITSSITLVEPVPLAITLIPSVYAGGYNLSGCTNDGYIDLQTSGGSPLYNFTWSTAGGNGLIITDEDQSGLTAGTYIVTATDQNGCVISDVITLINPLPMTESVSAFTYPSGDNISCFGLSDGSINLTNTGGTSPYTYIWSSPDGSGLVPSNEDQSGLTAGTYNVTTTDANGCTITSTITLNEPAPLADSIAAFVYPSGDNISCFGLNDGSIDLTITDGSPGYTYVWSTSDGTGLSLNTEDQSAVTAGTYNVVVTDLNGCSILSSITLVEPTLLDITLTPSLYAGGYNLSGCTNDGFIDLLLTGGSPEYSFTWNSINGSGLVLTDEDQTGLTSGTYDVTATDLNGCIIASTIVLTEPTQLTESITAFIYPSGDNISCTGANDGSINLTNTGGTPPYTFAWSTLDGSGLVPTNEDQNGLTIGTYDVVTTDANGCSITSSITLVEPAVFVQDITSSTFPSGENISCFGFSDGSIVYTVSGASPGYTYLWSNGAVTENITGLPLGSYAVTVTDINGCTTDTTFTLTEPTALTESVTSYTYPGGQNISCFGYNDGSIDLLNTNGSPSYTYVWSTTNGSGLVVSDEDQSGLTAGTYNVTVTDTNGCTVTSTITLTEPAPMSSITSVTTDYNGQGITCQGATDGGVTVVIVNGSPVYTYEWFDDQGTLISTAISPTGLGAGTYDVTATDLNGCTVSDSITIVEPSSFNLDLVISSDYNGQAISCFGASDGGINLTILGGTPGYTYTWRDSLSQIVGTSEDISGLPAGVYYVTIVDANGCLADTIISLDQPTEVDGIATVISNYNDQDISCFQASDGMITIDPTGGTPGYSYEWINSTGSLMGNLQNAGNLIAGTYTVEITDANGCTYYTNIQLSEPTQVVATIDILSDYFGYPISCSGQSDGEIQASGSGGTPGYVYQWNTNPIQTDSVLSDLGEGIYTVTITDINGCVTTQSLELEGNPLPLIDPNPAIEVCQGEMVTFGSSSNQVDACVWTFSNGLVVDKCGPNTVYFDEVGCYDASLIVTGEMGCIDSVFLTDYICINSNPIANYSASTYDPTILDNSVSFINESYNATNYEWDFGDGSFSFQEDVTHAFPSDNPGEYFVVLFAYNESNCVDSIGKLVKVWDKLFFYVPNTFTPDNDEFNQIFIPSFGSGYSFDNYEFSVYNRWGERIFETTDIYKGWDGMYHGDFSQDGTYTWKIILKASEDAMEEEQKNIYYGHVNLIR